MNRRTAWRGVLTLLLVAGFAASAAAQSTLGRLSGTVLDASGGVLPGATITLTSEQTNQVQTSVSSETGAFVFPQVPVGTYKVEIGMQGFRSATFTKVSVAVGQEYALTARLQLGNVSENITVEAGTSLVPTTSPEVTTTVEQQQIVSLPLNGRNPISLVQLQAGVASLGRTNTAINGGRPTWTQVTQDGINIQDNFIRTNSVDFVPNRPTSDNVSEFSIVTTAQGVDNAGGASQVRMVTPSGTNALRGNAYEYNRHSKFAEPTYFNKKAGLPVSYLNRNQFGGSVGGPVTKDKLFFYANYEAFRQKQQAAQNYTIPISNDLLRGTFRYFVAADGSTRTANVLQLSGQTIDPAVQASILSLYPSPDKVNSFDSGDSRADRILNTGRYRFLQDDFNDRNQWVTRGDYAFNTNHRFEVIYSYIKETDDRTDLDAVTLPTPLVFTDSHAHRYVGSWRWMASSRLSNELRIGGNLAPVDFKSDVDFSSGVLLNVPGISGLNSPLVTFQPQGRNTRTYQYSDTANLMMGNHAFQFGGSIEQVRINAYNFAARFPTVTFGLSSSAPAGIQLTAAQLPGIATADLTSANNLVAMLSGAITSLSQTFQVQSATSGYVGGIPNNRNWAMDNYSVFIQDNWRWKPNVTVRAGLKWEYFSPTREDDNLAFVPVLNGQTAAEAAMNPATTVSFSKGGLWNSDWNNLGPTLGVAWDPFKDGRTSVRAGYSLTFVNEEGATVGSNLAANAGLSTAVSQTNLFQRLAAGTPVLPTPAFKTTRTMADQIAVSLTSPIRAVNQDIKQPRVHQFSAGITREIMWNMAVEARYVGSRGRDIWRGVDLNQLDAIGALGGAFAADFQRARQNGFLAQAAGGGFVPDFNPNIPGSQVLTVLPTFGQLGNATARTAIQQNELARLADFYMSTAGGPTTAARNAFLANPGIYTSEYMDNTSFQDYDALQLELRRQFRNGIFGQINYTLSETRSDSIGTGSQNRIEPFLDNARPELDKGLSPYHNAHVINANAVVELPFGSGKPWLNGGGWTDGVFGGWQLATIVKWQSGATLSINSGRGTFNRTGRSGRQTAVTSLTTDQIKDLFGLYTLPDGRLSWVNPSVMGSDGRLAAPDNTPNASFNGQAFFNPAAGGVGNIEVNRFEGPSQFVADLSVQKRVRFGRGYGLIARADIFNVFNTVNWSFGDLDINSTTGAIIDSTGGARLMQFSIKFEF